MNMIKVVGIDITKSVFQVCVWMDDGSLAWNKKISRSRLQDTVRQFEPGTLIAIEACSTSPYTFVLEYYFEEYLDSSYGSQPVCK